MSPADLQEFMSMWVPSPQRRVLYESAGFVYAFGNTKHASLWRATKQEKVEMLLLGFGDVRNVLSTASACAADPKSARCRQLCFHLNDISPLNVARGLLLLHLANTINPSLGEDLEFFWGVSYCLALPAAHATRLHAAVQQLLAAPAALHGWFRDSAQAVQIEAVLRGWLLPAPAVAALQAERSQLQMQRMSQRSSTPIKTPDQLGDVLAQYALSMVVDLLPWSFQGIGQLAACAKHEALLAEAREYLEAGSIYGSGAAAAGSGTWAANATLLEPHTQRWKIHYSASPFLTFISLDPARHGGIFDTNEPRALTQACLADLQALLRGYQACRAQRRIEVVLWCSEALKLCAHVLAPSQQRFDVIDTSNLSDHVGLLNLLTHTSPLLHRTPHARLLTGHMVWGTGASALHEYVRVACGADPRLFPTLLGLRLMNDPMYGREQPRNPMTCYGFTDASDTLEWQPAGLDPAALPSVTGGDGISSALEAWGGLCCKQENLPPGDRSGLGLCTALTLLHLASGLAGRVQRLLPLQEPHCGAGSEKQALWCQLADSLATLCGVPEKGMLQLRALCCWAVQQQVTAGQLQPQQQRQAQTQAPLLVTGKVPLLAAYRAHVKAGRTPLLGVLLVHVPAGTPLSAVLGPGGDVTGAGMNTHLVDVLGFDSTEGELSFLLPPDHELGSGYTVLSLISQTTGEKMSEVIPLQRLRSLPFTAPPPAWLAGLQGLLHYPIDSGTAGTNTSGSSQGGSELSSGLVLRRLAEHADRFELEFVVGDELGGTVTSSGLQLAFPDAPAGGGACRQLQLTLKEPAKLRAMLSLPWPVDSSTAKVRVRRSTRTISAMLPKHLLWPGDSAWLSKVAVDSLPAWGQGSDNSDELSTLLAMMFSHPELQAKSRGVTLGGGGMSSMYDVKESVQALFVHTYLNGTHMHQLRCGSAGPHDEPELTVVVHGGGVKRLPDGRPLLHLSYVDHVSAMRQFPSEASQSAPMRRFSKIMRFLSAAGRGPLNTVNCTADELRLLRFILARNAAATLVPSWQAKLLELPSEWHASYLVPLFTDFLVLSEGPKLIDQLKDSAVNSSSGGSSASRQSPEPRRRATAVTPQLGAGGGAQAARAAVLQHKEAGNALFKQRRYAAAVDEYQGGVQALQLVLLDVVATGTGLAGNLPELMSLKADLSNNTAMALIKQAESGPSAARANCLAQALKECTAVIDMDASNSKALYRRALVHHKMGNISAAQQDLSKLPAGGEDAAVESLRRQLEAAL